MVTAILDYIAAQLPGPSGARKAPIGPSKEAREVTGSSDGLPASLMTSGPQPSDTCRADVLAQRYVIPKHATALVACGALALPAYMTLRGGGRREKGILP